MSKIRISQLFYTFVNFWTTMVPMKGIASTKCQKFVFSLIENVRQKPGRKKSRRYYQKCKKTGERIFKQTVKHLLRNTFPPRRQCLKKSISAEHSQISRNLALEDYLKLVFDSFRLIEVWRKEHCQHYLNRMVRQKAETFDWDLGGQSQGRC